MPRGGQSAEPLWRAIAVFRFAGLGYAVLLTAVINRAEYARLGWAPGGPAGSRAAFPGRERPDLA